MKRERSVFVERRSGSEEVAFVALSTL